MRPNGRAQRARQICEFLARDKEPDFLFLSFFFILLSNGSHPSEYLEEGFSRNRFPEVKITQEVQKSWPETVITAAAESEKCCRCQNAWGPQRRTEVS